ncbi:hybrid sensor histidine kinase/response regulator transcription factor [Aliikangiella coralliicola]|uniref:histidine kinase n=1 Tax=Aliikangiella coralliicola TaxID=2592383 RepID=A0A545UF40_9GAMM|nr:ATP-binding protein [Aliikangiella coralliicola]TQV88003.1 response regulator [Aliikangiella coralliicola]
MLSRHFIRATIVLSVLFLTPAFAFEFINVGAPVINIEQVNKTKLGKIAIAAQDHRGFIWLVGDDGMFRYDGSDLKTSLEFQRFSISNVTDVIKGGGDNLWIGTSDFGLVSYEFQSEQFVYYGDDESLHSQLVNLPIDALVQKNSELVVASGSKIFVLDEQTLAIKKQLSIDIPASDNIVRLLLDSSGNIWCSTANTNGVYLFKNDELVRFKHDPKKSDSVSSAFVISIFEDSKKQIWLGTVTGIDRFNPATQNFQHYTPLDESNERVKTKGMLANLTTSIVEDLDGYLWLGLHNSGVVRFDPEAETFSHFREVKGVNSTLSTNGIFGGLFFDNQQTVWALTLRGLSQLKKNTRNLAQWLNMGEDNCTPLRMFEFNESVYFACGKTVYRFQKDNRLEKLTTFNQIITDLSFDQNNQLWVGTVGGGAYRYNPKTNQSKQYQFSSNTNENLAVNSILTLHPDASGILYGTTFMHSKSKGSGFIQYDETTDRFSNLGLDFNLVNFIDINAEKMLWISGNAEKLDKSLYWYDKRTRKYTQLPFLTGNVYAVLKWEQNIWVSSEKLGLFKFDLQSEQITKITIEGFGVAATEKTELEKTELEKTELEKSNQERVTGLYLKQDSNELLISSSKDLYRVNSIANNRIEAQCITCAMNLGYLGLNNDTSGQLANSNGFLFDNNRFLISTGNQLFDINLDEVKPEKLTGQLALTNFKVMNKSLTPSADNVEGVLSQNINYASKVTIPADNTFFSIEFAYVNFINTDAVQYAYKLEGLNDEWVYTDGTRREAVFTSLPSKDYVFKVKSTNHLGIWDNSVEPVSLSITVLPPWWRTWWAYSLYLIASLGLVSFIFWLIYRRKIAETARQSAMAITMAKEQLFANLSHEFRTPLTLILGPADAIKNREAAAQTRKDVELIQRNGQRLLFMVDQLLDLARLRGDRSNAMVSLHVASICQFVVSSFQSTMTEKNISLNIEPAIDDSWWVSGTKDSLETILFNLISNAFKYSPFGSEIRLSLKSETNYIQFQVVDSGCGIAAEAQQKIFERFTRLENADDYASGAGIGLALVKELVESIGGKITVQSELGKGSTFFFSLSRVSPPDNINQDKLLPEESHQLQVIVEQLKHATVADDRRTTDVDTDVNNIRVKETNTKAGASATEASAKIEKQTLLVVEDNVEMRGFIRQSLQQRYAIMEAADGKQGAAMAREKSPDLIISDVMMPKMNGFELLETIRNDLATSHIPFILLTAKGDRESRLKGLSELADDYVTKPFNADELIVRIQNLLGLRTILQTRYSEVAEQGADFGNVAGALSGKDQEFLEKIMQLISDKYRFPELTLSTIASAVAMSDRQLQRKLKAILGKSFTELLRNYRLEQGALLLQEDLQVALIADRIGFSSSTYFVRCFKAKFGKTPTEYRQA